MNFSIFVGQNFIVQVVVPRRQIPTSSLGSLYIFLHFSLLDKKHLGSRETHVFRLVENGRGNDVTTWKFKGCCNLHVEKKKKKKKKLNIGNLETCCSQFLWMEQILLHSKYIYFFRELQFMTSVFYDSFLSSDQNTNRFLMQAKMKFQISYLIIRDFTNWANTQFLLFVWFFFFKFLIL